MRVYEHSARCPIALRAFLDCNTHYWCFIPMPWDDALSDNINYLATRADAGHALMEDSDSDSDNEEEDLQLQNYLDRVPLTPTEFVFSLRQRRQQRQFFRNFLSLSLIQVSYRSLDLYQYKIITVCTYQNLSQSSHCLPIFLSSVHYSTREKFTILTIFD